MIFFSKFSIYSSLSGIFSFELAILCGDLLIHLDMFYNFWSVSLTKFSKLVISNLSLKAFSSLMISVVFVYNLAVNRFIFFFNASLLIMVLNYWDGFRVRLKLSVESNLFVGLSILNLELGEVFGVKALVGVHEFCF